MAKKGAFVDASIQTPISVPPIVRHVAASTALDVAATNDRPFVWTETGDSDGSMT
jgi:hypothetical protein